MAKETRYTFLEKEKALDTVVSLILSAASALILLLAVMFSFSREGQANAAAGAAGLMGALFSLYAFWLGMKALTRKEGRFRNAAAAAILSGILLIIWGGIALLGLA